MKEFIKNQDEPKRKYLSEAITPDYQKKVFNVIEAPCGSGKTYYALHGLVETILGEKPQYNKMLYLIDTCAGRGSIIDKNSCLCRDFDQYIDTMNEIAFSEIDQSNDKSVVMTFAKFGVLMRKMPEYYKRFSLIVVDEYHSIAWPLQSEKMDILKKYKNPNKMDTIIINALLEEQSNSYAAMKGIKTAVLDGQATVVLISATPPDMHTWQLWKDVPVHKIQVAKDVFHYKENEVIPFSDPKAVLNQLQPGEKALVYIAHIREMKKWIEYCRARGIRCEGIWSLNNKEHPMTDEQVAIRDKLIGDGEFPDRIDVFFINKSMCTSVNINTKVSKVIAYTSNRQDQIQARGRIRSDIDKFYVFQDASIIDPNDPRLTIHYGEWLDTEQRKELAQKMKSRHITGWNTLKRALESNGFIVELKRMNDKRYYRIFPPVDRLD